MYQTKLSRHIKLKHKKVKEVEIALGKSKKERIAHFSKLKKDGILKANKNIMKMGGEQSSYERERVQKASSATVLCSKCNGFYAKNFFKRHKTKCIGESADMPSSIPATLLACESVQDEFRNEVMSHFITDEIGQVCSSDATILAIGQRLWDGHNKKLDKKSEVKRSVRTDMRRLAGLYICFRDEQKIDNAIVTVGNASDMFQRRNFKILETSIKKFTTGEQGLIKPGLKMSLFYLLKSSAKILKATYLVQENDDQALEIDKFVAILDLNHNYIFGDAIYGINKSKQTKLRKPEVMPLEADVKKMRQFSIDTMSNLLGDKYLVWGAHEYISLRDTAASRLTLFNARRGGEPSRLTLTEWEDAESGAWVDQTRVQALEDPIDKLLVNSMKVTYQTGKGNNHLVPVLIPLDTYEAVKKLADPESREQAGVRKENPYLFPSTQDSDCHISGWHAIHSIAKQAGVANIALITATKMRHRISTLYASQDIPESQRHVFYKHMGHSENINKNVYQSPLALMEITHVGKHLSNFDNGNVLLIYF